jgi:hypothetical protein
VGDEVVSKVVKPIGTIEHTKQLILLFLETVSRSARASETREAVTRRCPEAPFGGTLGELSTDGTVRRTMERDAPYTIRRIKVRLVKSLAIAAVALFTASVSADATRYNQRFDCGNGLVVWVAIGPYGPEGRETREPQLLFEVSMSKFDFEKGPVRTPRFSFDGTKRELKADGKLCLSPEERDNK